MNFKFVFDKVILSIIPYSFIYFFKKKISINYVLFGKAKVNTGVYVLNNTETEFPLYSMENSLGKEVIEGFKFCYHNYKSHKNFLRKYILAVDNCIIEPMLGWGIQASDNKLVFDSISNNSWIEAYHPSFFDYIRNRKSTINYPQLISINIIGGGENNYWHFLHDLLGQVALAKKELPDDVPFLISKNLAGKSFFKDALLRSDYLNNCTWLIRDDIYYKADQAYFIQTMPNNNEQFFNVREMLRIKNSDKLKKRKIFLKRNKSRKRYIKNNNEIERIARQYNFEIVDTDYLSLQEQIELFGETKFLIGIHGAGLTNVFYRKNAPLHLLELLPKDYVQPHYFWLSKGMGHNYSCLVGSASSYNTSFYIEPKKFEEKLSQMLNSNF